MWSRCAICSHSVTIPQANSISPTSLIEKPLRASCSELFTEMLIGLRHGLGRASLAA